MIERRIFVVNSRSVAFPFCWSAVTSPVPIALVHFCVIRLGVTFLSVAGDSHKAKQVG
jgi:hypothetical protein